MRSTQNLNLLLENLIEFARGERAARLLHRVGFGTNDLDPVKAVLERHSKDARKTAAAVAVVRRINRLLRDKTFASSDDSIEFQWKPGYRRPKILPYNKGDLERGTWETWAGSPKVLGTFDRPSLFPVGSELRKAGLIGYPGVGAAAAMMKQGQNKWLRDLYGTPEKMSKSIRRHEIIHSLYEPENLTRGNVKKPLLKGSKLPRLFGEFRAVKGELFGKHGAKLGTPFRDRLHAAISGMRQLSDLGALIEFAQPKLSKLDELVAAYVRKERPGRYAGWRPLKHKRIPKSERPPNAAFRTPAHESERIFRPPPKPTFEIIRRQEEQLSAKLDDIIQFKRLYQPRKEDEPPETLPEFTQGEPVDYTVQQHKAKRAGFHRDIRIGTPRHGLLSWATRKELPAPGGKIAIHPQSVHAHDYLGWEGDIASGYGAGKVSTEHLGKALITHSSPTEIHATLADQKEHHRLAFLKTAKGWLLTRGKHPEPPTGAQKPKYKSVSPEKAHEHLSQIEPGTIVQPKVDGALVYVKTEGGRPEIFSHRISKTTGKHPIHTERVFGGRPTVNIPREHQRTLIAELYGEKGGKAIQPQELGGILNTHIGESLQKQKTRGIKLKIMPFDYVDGHKGEAYPERLAKIQETLRHLPREQFHMPETATTPHEARGLFERIRRGKHPLTSEGVIVHPPHGKMTKIKNVEEANVKITGTFPGAGKFEGSHGGITYEGGRVGTGFSDETRRQLHEHIGRIARIRHQGKYPSGAYRAPSFIAIEENK
jgi:hypothetical protein